MADTWTPDELHSLTHDDVRRLCDRISDHIAEWQGIPVPLGEDSPLVLADGHPLRDFYRQLGELDGYHRPAATSDRVCSTEDVCEEERVVNEWFSRRRNCTVIVIDRAGRRSALTIPVSPDRSMERLNLWLTTLGAADAWDLNAEHVARNHLRSMISDRQWRHYDLTGSFLETSPRSRLTYVLRRLRPTIALSPRGRHGEQGPDISMRCVAVLCLHPIGYYARSWGGCLVPTDDVIAHLTMIRGDEADYWRHANQHSPSSPEAGL